LVRGPQCVGVKLHTQPNYTPFRVNSLYLVAKSAQVAREWRAAINDFIRAYKFRHSPPMHCLQKR